MFFPCFFLRHGSRIRLPLDEMQQEHHLLGQIYLFSHDMQRTAGAANPEPLEELGVIRVLHETGEAENGAEHILKETDLITL